MVFHDLWYNCWTFVYFDLFITLTFQLCWNPFLLPELPFLCWPPFPIVYPTNILLTIPSCLPWPIVAEQLFTLNYCLPSIHFVYCLVWLFVYPGQLPSVSTDRSTSHQWLPYKVNTIIMGIRYWCTDQYPGPVYGQGPFVQARIDWYTY